MMKGGKEEDKIMGPLFPRLHVNDADKGGPRAPPRNKMALYEQLSIPSQRFNSASAPARPLPPYNAGTSISSASSNQGGGNERSVFSPFYIPQSPAQSAEMVQSRPFDATYLQSTRMELARSVGHANYESSNAVGSVAECSSIRARDFSSVKKSCEERLDDEDDFRVPTFVQSEVAHSNKDTHVMETNRLTPLHSNSPPKSCSATRSSPIRFPSSYDNTLEQGIAVKSRKHEKRYTEHNSKETVVIKENKEKYVSHLETREKFVEASNYSKACSDQEHTSTRHFIENTRQRSITICEESGNGAMDGHLNDIDDAENEDALRRRTESCTKASFLSSHRGQSMAGNYDRGNDDKVTRSVELIGAEKNDDVSETSMVDSISGLEISPDDVVGIIGPKQFWKARRAIVNQQRVFAVQLFELHRLIKVQKLIASSPQLLLEENQYLSGSPQKVPNKNLPPESMAKPQPQITKQKDDSLKLNQDTDCRTENTEVPPLSSQDDGHNQGLCQLPRYGSYSGNPPHSVPVAPENRPTAWCYPAANHWLVPVMSPSEGLIYKPCTGPCPPAAGFMAPVYGGCGPLGVPAVPGGFMNAAYGVPASHHQENMASGAPPIASNYFPTPYSLPVVNPNLSNSAVEQVGPIMRPSPGQIEQRSGNSCNMAVARSEAFSGGPWKAPASKDSELQGSTASSPFERSQGRDALPLFPTAPAMVGPACPSESHDEDHQSRVIKVVPHNARSATESAARIFRSIQEERQQEKELRSPDIAAIVLFVMDFV